MRFPPTELSAAELALRRAVREFLRDALPGSRDLSAEMGGGHDPAFSRTLAARGWVGMAIPEEYGGSGRTAVDRFVVVGELLAAGAPVSAHWIADRQTAPSILAFGTEAQKHRFLPAIARGECFFAIGMSEPDAGSDLAAVRTRAVPDGSGWRLSGTKVWTSGAHVAHHIQVLCRTSPSPGDRHEGLGQLIVDLTAPGVTVRPITGLDGSRLFNEVVFDDVFVPGDGLLGEAGAGWRQVGSELAYERSGPDRWLSTFGLFTLFVREYSAAGDRQVREATGRITAKYRTLRALSLSVARMIDAGGAPAAEAALIKDLGTTFEQEVAETVRSLARIPPEAGDDPFSRALARITLNLPSFTIRGGTTEILRSVAAKELLR